MENREERTLSFCYMTHRAILRELDLISNSKPQISTLKILNCEINGLQKLTFNGFDNLTDLNLSKCNILCFVEDVFETLICLKSINLSDNTISFIDNNLFKKNRNLNTIILKNNRLVGIDRTVFLFLEKLEVLDLSHNKILVLLGQFYHCQGLRKLYLNNNCIKYILPMSFNKLVNLTGLTLNDNMVTHLEEFVFHNLVNLRYLNLDNNLINAIHLKCFVGLINLKMLYLANNFFEMRLKRRYLQLNNANLIELDLSGSYCLVITTHMFDNCLNLKILKLSVTQLFQISAVTKLKHLTEFELMSKLNKFCWSYYFGTVIEKLVSVSVLKFVFQKLSQIRLCNFSNLKKLEYLHIECLEPSYRIHSFQLQKVLSNSSQLKHLVLKKLNYFNVYKHDCQLPSLKHLNLSGIKLKEVPCGFFNYVLLEHLNLSFSKIEIILQHTFEDLVNLEYLELQFSKLRCIKSMAFVNNRNLQVLNCSHCCIEIIQDGAFLNQHLLRELNLSYNPLRLTISDDLFKGLNREFCSITL